MKKEDEKNPIDWKLFLVNQLRNVFLEWPMSILYLLDTNVHFS